MLRTVCQAFGRGLSTVLVPAARHGVHPNARGSGSAAGNGMSVHLPVVEKNSPELPRLQLPRRTDPLLVVNRGAAASNAIRQARELGIAVVAVIARGDVVPEGASRVVELPGTGTGAYLDVVALTEVAKRFGTPWLWPGWGFLSENAEAHYTFRRAGIWVVGPEPSVVRSLGDKTSAREIAMRAGAPIVPGINLPVTLEQARGFGEEFGYPILVKAVSGGGGRGMRVANGAAELEQAYADAKAEAKACFNDDRVFIERFVTGRTLHVEGQVVGDLHGDVRHFSTRACSLQRRNQKLLEEAPADPRFDYLADLGVRIAHEAGYHSAGTAEFIVVEKDDGTHEAYFMEVNTRLQVEHLATEGIFPRLRLITAQLRIAMGEPLAAIFANVGEKSGHSVHVRVNAEALMSMDGKWNTAPTPGPISRSRLPVGHGVRFEGNPHQALVPAQFDSTIAQFTVTGSDRMDALTRLDRALQDTHVGGPQQSTVTMLRWMARQEVFKAGTHHLGSAVEWMNTPECQRFTFDPQNNPDDQVDRLLRYLTHVTVNGPLLDGIVNPIDPHVSAPPLPDLTGMPENPNWPLYGRIWRQAGGGEAGAVAVVSAWRTAALSGSRFLLTTTVFRDTPQTVAANRFRNDEKRLSVPVIGRLPWASVETGMGAETHGALLRREDPLRATAELQELMDDQITSGLGRGRKVDAYGDKPQYEEAYQAQYKVRVREGGLRMIRPFSPMNDFEDLQRSMLAIANAGAIVDAALVFHRRYDANFYAQGFARLYRFATDHAFADRLVFTIKDAQGRMNMDDLERLREVPSMVDRLSGAPQIIGIHSHDSGGISGTLLARSAFYGYRRGDVTNEMLAGRGTQPSVATVVQLLQGTAYDTRFPLEAMDCLAPHDLGLVRAYTPFMGVNELTANVAQKTGLPPGMTNNVRIQFLRNGGKPNEFPRFFHLYSLILDNIANCTGVTPSSKDVGQMAIWVMNGDKGGRIKTVEDVVQFVVENAAGAPDSTKTFFRGEKGSAQFGFEPRVEAAFRALPADRVPDMTPPPGRYSDAVRRAHDQLQGEFHRTLPEYWAHLHLWFPAETDGKPSYVQDMLSFQRAWGIYTDRLPISFHLRGLRVGEEVVLPDIGGQYLRIQLAAVSAPDTRHNRTVAMRVNDRPLVLETKDTKLAVQAGSGVQTRKLIERPTDHQAVASMPGSVCKVSVKVGQTVKKGDPLATVEAMKMQMVVLAKADGVVDSVDVTVGENVESSQLLLTLK